MGDRDRLERLIGIAGMLTLGVGLFVFGIVQLLGLSAP